jgi:putative transposase
MARKEIFAVGEYYHIYNRGTDQRVIFSDERDSNRFISLLYLANGTVVLDLWRQGGTLKEVVTLERGETLAEICAYCLMPNHFHLLLREKQNRGVSAFMQKLTTAYTMYFNKRNNRNGALFQGSFKAKHVEGDEYLKYLVSYIHLNPVKIIEPTWKETGIADKQSAESFLRKYPYSSYLDFSMQEPRLEKAILANGSLPEYFNSTADFNKTVQYWLGYREG